MNAQKARPRHSNSLTVCPHALQCADWLQLAQGQKKSNINHYCIGERMLRAYYHECGSRHSCNDAGGPWLVGTWSDV
eukprot:6196907-Pleurochrysis_carterae.AAC.2